MIDNKKLTVAQSVIELATVIVFNKIIMEIIIKILVVIALCWAIADKPKRK